MGQAAVDLPDSPSPPPASAQSTDDLLAQMAGEEIDRLLAEADGERPPNPAPAPAAPAQRAAPPVAAAETSKSSASQLDGFLGGLATDSGPDPVAQLASSSQSPAAGAAHDGNRPDPLGDDDSAAERGALNSSVAGHAGAAQLPSGELTVPLPVRLLAWVNSPLESCPDQVRETIGKVAILTAVNAISVLVYVLFFRHH
jgi:hypothetical protein